MKRKSIISFTFFILLTFHAWGAPEWKEGTSYTVGDIVTWQGHDYESLQSHIAYVGANWTPVLAPTLWDKIEGSPSPPPSPAPCDNNEGSSDVCYNTLLHVNFDHLQPNVYQVADFKNDWGISPTNSSGLSAGRLHIIQDPMNAANQALLVTYEGKSIGGNSAMVFNVPLSNSNKSLWLQYRVRFDPHFDWVKGGKLPGLAGGDRPSGCIDNNAFDGFTSRLMWRENGEVYGYLYFPTKMDRCGDYFPTTFKFQKGVWYTITQQVVLNDIGKTNGSFILYINGEKLLNMGDVEWRRSEHINIDAIKMDTFFGGSTQDWAPETDQYAIFDDFTVTTFNPITYNN